MASRATPRVDCQDTSLLLRTDACQQVRPPATRSITKRELVNNGIPKVLTCASAGSKSAALVEVTQPAYIAVAAFLVLPSMLLTAICVVADMNGQVESAQRWSWPLEYDSQRTLAGLGFILTLPALVVYFGARFIVHWVRIQAVQAEEAHTCQQDGRSDFERRINYLSPLVAALVCISQLGVGCFTIQDSALSYLVCTCLFVASAACDVALQQCMDASRRKIGAKGARTLSRQWARRIAGVVVQASAVATLAATAIGSCQGKSVGQISSWPEVTGVSELIFVAAVFVFWTTEWARLSDMRLVMGVQLRKGS